MNKPADTHPLRNPINNNIARRGFSTSKPNEEQRKAKLVRDRIEDIKAQREFDALWAE